MNAAEVIVFTSTKIHAILMLLVDLPILWLYFMNIRRVVEK
jgi:hypothetical protein